MRECVRNAFLQFTQHFEGLCLFMYLDVMGLVTTGYGNLIDQNGPAHLSAFDWRALDGNPVEPAEVLREWERVKGLQRLKQMGGGVFRHYTRLRATQASVDAFALHVLDGMWAKMLKHFPEAEEWPADAQLGLLSMAWACGENFPPKWPKFSEAARNQRWTVCAEESHIVDRANPGVRPRNEADRTLFLNAAQTCTPESLTYKV